MRFYYGFQVATITACSAIRLLADLYRADDEDVASLSGVSGLGHEEEQGFPYDFSGSAEWKAANFADKWTIFRNAVPLPKLQANFDPLVDHGPVCHPSLTGPEDSNKLAILMHGFLSCPGVWFRVVPRLVAEGFRVMLPTLPGHGRAWRIPEGSTGKINNTIVDLEAGPITNGEHVDFDLSNAEDDIEDIPRHATPYEIFAGTLGELAKQFKKEHPSGIVVVAGHSLGGAITARYAMDIPDVVDRVMLFNPFFGLAYGWVHTITQISPNLLLSKGSKCEGQRSRGSGGTCQFRLANVRALTDFGYSTLCNHMGVLTYSDCKVERNQSLGKMKHIQVVTTRGEAAVDNSLISKFVKVIDKERALQQGLAIKDNTLCQWPSELGHSYLSNRRSRPSINKWWHPYVEHVSTEFLTRGQNVDIVTRGSINDCLSRSANIENEHLNLLPAVQHSDFYNIGRPGGVDKALVAFSGYGTKQSHTWGIMHERQLEIIVYRQHHLVVTRLHEDDDVRNIFVIRQNSLVELIKEGEIYCMKLSLDDVSENIPLNEAVAQAEASRIGGSEPRILKFCGNCLVHHVCNSFSCTSGDGNSTIMDFGHGRQLASCRSTRERMPSN
mmetsp:Transcript_12383/g.20222  ORF Transcript_12383/g.20222 Transcript_12383/m.20222 type:complete len:611 (+) Transcript_12383:61-1893(+)